LACAISQDKSIIMIHYENPYQFGYITVTWAGSTPTFSSTSAWTFMGDPGGNIDFWSMAFVGGNSTTPSTYIIGFDSNGANIHLYKWTNSTKTIGTPTNCAINNTATGNLGSVYMCGANGNVYYLPHYNGATYSVDAVTLSIS